VTDEALAALRQQATALRAQAMAVVMGADALLAALPAPQPQDAPPPAPRTLGND
jgi:hypothetical protein